MLVQDSLALLALYNSTNGDNWNFNVNWFDEDILVNDWYGIEVENQRVVQINLQSYNLVGDIPSEISNLDSLSFLNLSDNSISSLPSSIGSCSILKELWLNVNNIQEIPSEIENLLNLEYLVLGLNNINVLPDEIYNLTSLKFLNFAGNGIDSILPLIENLINLENFQFFNNNITFIPEEIGNCANLVYINGYGNDIDSLPHTLVNLPMQTLALAYNSLTFDDIEPIFYIIGFQYWAQDSIGVNIDTTVFIDSTYYMEIQTGGEFNKYQWKKNNVIIEGATNNYFEITNITLADSGIYNCEITNTVATGLTLQSRLIDLHVEIDTRIDKSIYESKAISLNIFPNPAYDKISIQINSEFPLDELDILLFNQYGKLIRKYGLETRKQSELNISNVNKGVYYIQVKDAENGSFTKTEKIIKL